MTRPLKYAGLDNQGETTINFILPLVILLLLTLAFAYMMPEFSTKQALAFVGGILLFVLCLTSTETALYLLIFSMLLGPEFIVGGAEGSSMRRGITLRLDDFVILIIAFSWLAKMAMNKELGLFRRTPLNKPIAYYIIICLTSTLLASIYGKVKLTSGFFFVLKYFEYVFIYFMVSNHIKEKRQVQNYTWAMLITCAIVSVLGILQIPEGGRVSAPFEGKAGEPNTFGGYLVFMISITAGLLLTTISLRKRFIYGFMLLLFLIPLIFTRSRGSYLALFPAMLTFVWLSEKRRWVITALIFAVVILPFAAPKAVKERVGYTFTQRYHKSQLEVGGVRLDTSTSDRLRSWFFVLRDIVKHPVLGFGVTGYRFIDAQYFRVLIETGILGLAIFFLLISNIFRQAYRIFREIPEPFEKGISMGFLAGLMGLLVHAIGANTFIIVRIMEPFWFILAMIIAMPNLETESSSGEPSSKSL